MHLKNFKNYNEKRSYHRYHCSDDSIKKKLEHENGKILIVDDMQMHLETAKIYLDMSGYEVYTAADAKNAWMIITDKLPDLVLLDVVLPGENGLDLLSKINAYYPGTGVIIMTSHGSEEIAATALKLGAMDYIKKPILYSSLSQVVKKAITRQREVKSRDKAVETLKSAYEELQVSAESILQCMSAGVVAIDKNLQINMINRRAKELLGAEKRDVVGKRFYDVFPQLDKISLLRKTIKNQRGVRLYEIYIPGTGKIVNVNTDVIFDFHGKIIGAVAVLDDVTELRRKEQLLKDQERLAIIGQMAAGMAHELKNPLTSIKGLAQLLAEKPGTPIPNEFLQVMLSEINRMNQVIHDFLQLARPKPPELKMTNINDVIREISPIIGPQAFLKNISLSIKTSNDVPGCLMDSNQIKQVILNFVQNSMEAMEGKGDILIETAFLAGQNEIRLDISDTGPGIPAGVINKIGVPFYTTKPDGTGLGLSISYTIVEQHKGRVEVQSQEGRGTKFSIYIPIK